MTATPTDATVAEPDDSGVWDFERGMKTIRSEREINRGLRAENQRYRAAVAAVLGGRETPEGIIIDPPAAEPAKPTAPDAPDAAVAGLGEAVATYEATLRQLGQVLGIPDADVAAPGGAEALIAAAKLSKSKQFAPSSGVPFPAGSGGAPQPISRSALAFLPPATVENLRKTGQLAHLGVGPDDR